MSRMARSFTSAETVGRSGAGLATLIEYFQSVQSFKGKLALASLSPRVKNVFEIVRLEQIFSIHPDVPSALAALKA